MRVSAGLVFSETCMCSDALAEGSGGLTWCFLPFLAGTKKMFFFCPFKLVQHSICEKTEKDRENIQQFCIFNNRHTREWWPSDFRAEDRAEALHLLQHILKRGGLPTQEKGSLSSKAKRILASSEQCLLKKESASSGNGQIRKEKRIPYGFSS